MTDERTCPHETSEPVEVRDHTTGGLVTVARICTTCLAQLPAAWGCPACEWSETRALCDPVPQLLLARPCQEHA
ncbi:hypothetical protein [Nocardioides sp. T2.26MG-1]|uniref:hypothetical protein n=1 Tax=Nocardioides sp. T2.26MG-1 TaxID=3041166 RepID=UPI002477CBAC|nr:hypothetical protein [Nocardioides sp. T2.26MG-1]CAI9417292.1 hypothetical protein HIDPHFAB_02984 [Nocardioides sp. T2.26MG-1]